MAVEADHVQEQAQESALRDNESNNYESLSIEHNPPVSVSSSHVESNNGVAAPDSYFSPAQHQLLLQGIANVLEACYREDHTVRLVNVQARYQRAEELRSQLIQGSAAILSGGAALFALSAFLEWIGQNEQAAMPRSVGLSSLCIGAGCAVACALYSTSVDRLRRLYMRTTAEAMLIQGAGHGQYPEQQAPSYTSLPEPPPYSPISEPPRYPSSLSTDCSEELQVLAEGLSAGSSYNHPFLLRALSRAASTRPVTPMSTVAYRDEYQLSDSFLRNAERLLTSLLNGTLSDDLVQNVEELLETLHTISGQRPTRPPTSLRPNQSFLTAPGSTLSLDGSVFSNGPVSLAAGHCYIHERSMSDPGSNMDDVSFVGHPMTPRPLRTIIELPVQECVAHAQINHTAESASRLQTGR